MQMWGAERAAKWENGKMCSNEQKAEAGYHVKKIPQRVTYTHVCVLLAKINLKHKYRLL